MFDAVHRVSAGRKTASLLERRLTEALERVGGLSLEGDGPMSHRETWR